MQFPDARTVGAALLALAMVACGKAQPPAPDTTTLGAANEAATAAGRAPLTDARGRPIPVLQLPAGTRAELARVGDEAAVAVWVQGGNPVAASYAPATGWSPPQPLETIHGEASDAQLAANGRGQALALWRHTVGNIRSLRYSRYEAGTGWSVPDVMPGALPQPPGTGAAPELRMDGDGNAFARWRSGFDASQEQSSRFQPGQGWTRAASEPRAAASAPAQSR
jgi:hypothetical protein